VGREYHATMRRQKKAHWNEFLSDNANIWQAAKYIKPANSGVLDKVPPLQRADGSTSQSKAEQMHELLTTFFPPLPMEIEEEGQRPQRAPNKHCCYYKRAYMMHGGRREC
jgi:hypothetical protein